MTRLSGWLLCCVFSFLGACTSGSESRSQGDFENKAKCAAYWKAETDDLYRKSPNIVVGELFYSPKLNTCALSYYWPMVGDASATPVITYLITDVLTHGGLFSKNTVDDQNAREMWEAKVAELKTAK